MKVKNLRANLMQLDRILEIYKDRTLDEMLDDIYGKLSAQEILPQPKGKKKDDFDPSEAIARLEEINLGEMNGYLVSFTKDHLIQIGAGLNISLSKKDNKARLIALIMNRYKLVHLNQKIAKRPLPEEGGFLQDVIDQIKKG